MNSFFLNHFLKIIIKAFKFVQLSIFDSYQLMIILKQMQLIFIYMDISNGKKVR